MATFNLVITYPDADATRIMNAIKARATTTEVPNPSNAQATEWFRLSVTRALRDIVEKHERDAAVATAAASVVSPEVT